MFKDLKKWFSKEAKQNEQVPRKVEKPKAPPKNQAKPLTTAEVS